jgi:fructose-1-phosphate kinase PfkB-like protein
VDFDFQLLPAPRLSRLAKVTGAGDCFVAGLVWAFAVRGDRVAEATRWGLAGARAALETEPAEGAGGAIPEQLSPQLLERLLDGVDAVENTYT